jgi:iron complex transport system ATP-binding protein
LERGRHTAWVPQDASFEFGFTVQSVISQGRYAHGDDGKGVREAMERLDLAPLAARPVNRLSGGERQRVLLARAVTTGAPLQLWDEPLAQLDPRHVLETLALARELASRPGASLLLSLHDLSLARELDWLILLENGLLRAAGPPARILTPALLHSVFRVHATVAPGFALTL